MKIPLHTEAAQFLAGWAMQHAAGDRERCTKCLPIVARNVETLFLMSADEIGAFYGLNDLPQEKFFHLKYLELACKVAIVGPKTVISFNYRYLFLVPFLIDSPALETLICRYDIFYLTFFFFIFSVVWIKLV